MAAIERTSCKMNFGQFRHVVQGIVPPGYRLSFVVLESVAARHGRRRSKLVADLAAESGVGMAMEEELKMIAARDRVEMR